MIMLEWEALSNGLPETSETMTSILAANPKIAGVFYAINKHGWIIYEGL
jgi:hypothetical protein